MATITIRISEDADPNGQITVDHDIEGFDIETAKVNGDLPPALLLGANMLKLLDFIPSTNGLPIEDVGGRRGSKAE